MKKNLLAVFVLGFATLLLTGCMTNTSDEAIVDETVAEEVVVDETVAEEVVDLLEEAAEEVVVDETVAEEVAEEEVIE